ncbi:YrbL family protein [Ruegeria lacuscaerulensis]|uniref:YrbL family protein n=1 Tax=Ruegeria lacuscaerulensis TaxID=55218 RepID=UPI00147B54C3|nr:YrbL family protein [Ruegeria lacuscaerulensis]
MIFPVQLVHLSDKDLVATGGHRNVYAYPDQSDLLIKVTRPRTRPNRSFAKRVVRYLLPDSVYRNALKELECEMKAALKSGPDIAKMPLARSFGVVQTDAGPGIVVERMESEDGSLAQDLMSLSQQRRLPPEVLNKLNDFVHKLFDFQIVGRDIHAQNIVYGKRDSVPMFVLIDGYGERNLVPLRSLSRRLNDRSLNKQMHEIAVKTGLRWDAATRAFSAP